MYIRIKFYILLYRPFCQLWPHQKYLWKLMLILMQCPFYVSSIHSLLYSCLYVSVPRKYRKGRGKRVAFVSKIIRKVNLSLLCGRFQSSSNPCQNGGYCRNNGDRTYDCSCKSPYTGENCQES